MDTALPAIGRPACAWTDASRRFALHLGSDVVGRLKVPGGGLEVGGILLGRAETEGNTTNFWVDGFRAVESDHRLGPSYLLSESDFARLQDEIDKSGSGCLGIYRSQTRARKLALDVEDVRLFGKCFPTGNALLLMVSPALSGAAFFSRADADLKRVYEFGLGGNTSRIPPHNDQSVRLNRPRGRALPSRTSPIPIAKALAKLRLPANRRVPYIPALIAILVLAVVASGLFGFLSRRITRSSRAPGVIELKVQPTGSSLHVLWDANSKALRGAARVVLHIQDGDYGSDRNLSSSEVRSGSSTYEPRSGEVFFRMDAYPAAPSAIGSVQVINSLALSANRPSSPLREEVAKPQVRRVPPRTIEPPPRDGSVWLGMSLRPVTRAVAQTSHLPQTYGLLVTQIDARSSAGISGLESGDILLAVNAQRIVDVQDLEVKVREKVSGGSATLAVFRNGAIHQIEVNLGTGRLAQSATFTTRP